MTFKKGDKVKLKKGQRFSFWKQGQPGTVLRRTSSQFYDVRPAKSHSTVSVKSNEMVKARAIKKQKKRRRKDTVTSLFGW